MEPPVLCRRLFAFPTVPIAPATVRQGRSFDRGSGSLIVPSLMVGDTPLERSASPPSTNRTEGTAMDHRQTASPVNPPSTAERDRPRAAGHIKDFGEGRVCTSSDCGTMLSRYNRDTRCWVHEQLAKATVDVH
jgi:hypothetical protein